MDTEDATNLGAGGLAPAHAGVAEALGLGEHHSADGSDAIPSEDELEEIEHEGKPYRIPRALKGAFLMNADYTRKTQELAEHRRALEAERRALELNAQLAEATAQDRLHLAALDEQLAGFEGVEWEAYAAEDPQGAEQLWAQYQQMAQARERYAWQLARREHEGRLEAERRLAAELQETGRVLAQEIQGWSPEVASKLVEYAAAFGVTLEELREVADPRLWKILHRAHLGDQLVKQQEAAKNAAQAQAVRPAVQVSGAAAMGGGVRDELATGEWMRRRNAQAAAER